MLEQRNSSLWIVVISQLHSYSNVCLISNFLILIEKRHERIYHLYYWLRTYCFNDCYCIFQFKKKINQIDVML